MPGATFCGLRHSQSDAYFIKSSGIRQPVTRKAAYWRSPATRKSWQKQRGKTVSQQPLRTEFSVFTSTRRHTMSRAFISACSTLR